VRKRDLEILLERVPAHPKPRADLEQYRTPPVIAADLLWQAYALGDVGERTLVDLGCGTGMLALGALLLGAPRATGVDVDADALSVALESARQLGVADRFEIEHSDVDGLTWPADTAIMNPPFGAQKRHADRPFLDAAFRSSPVIWSIHLAETQMWVENYASRAGVVVTHAIPYRFPLKAQFAFHEKPVKDVDVVALRFTHGDDAHGGD